MSFTDPLLTFIRTNLLRDPNAPLTVDESLIDRGVIDSMGLIQILSFVETSTGVRVPDHMVVPDNFESVSAIVELVEKVRGG
jgi:acyl carrier protein